jgi:hypothetical protein
MYGATVKKQQGEWGKDGFVHTVQSFAGKTALQKSVSKNLKTKFLEGCITYLLRFVLKLHHRFNGRGYLMVALEG